MTKDQLIKEMQKALHELFGHYAMTGKITQEHGDHCLHLASVVPLTDTEERMEAMRLEILERSRAAAATSIPRACLSCGYAPCMCDQQ